MVDANLPRPASVRLLATAARPPASVPFGLTAWSDEKDAAALITVAPTEDATALAATLPDPSTLRDGTLVAVAGGAPVPRGLFAKLFAGASASISRDARATALVARGYTRIAAGVDASSGLDLVWGYARA